MEQVFGQDFSHVHAHIDKDARPASKELGAKAYTFGNDIAFSDPTPDKGTVAHELTHIVQHENSSGVQTNETTSKDTPSEYEARASQQAITNGEELPLISEALSPSSIAGDWSIEDELNFWQIQYSYGDTPADDLITVSFVSQSAVTEEGEEGFDTNVTPAELDIGVLLLKRLRMAGSLIESPQHPNDEETSYYIINPRLGEDVQEEIRGQLQQLNRVNTLISPAPEPGQGRGTAGEQQSAASGTPRPGYVHVYNSLGDLASAIRQIPNRGYLYNRFVFSGRPRIYSGNRPPMPDFLGPLSNPHQRVPSNCIYLVYALSAFAVGSIGVGQLGRSYDISSRRRATCTSSIWTSRTATKYSWWRYRTGHGSFQCDRYVSGEKIAEWSSRIPTR